MEPDDKKLKKFARKSEIESQIDSKEIGLETLTNFEAFQQGRSLLIREDRRGLVLSITRLSAPFRTFLLKTFVRCCTTRSIRRFLFHLRRPLLWMDGHWRETQAQDLA